MREKKSGALQTWLDRYSFDHVKSLGKHKSRGQNFIGSLVAGQHDSSSINSMYCYDIAKL